MEDIQFEKNLTNLTEENTAIISHTYLLNIDNSHDFVTVNVTKENKEDKIFSASKFLFNV